MKIKVQNRKHLHGQFIEFLLKENEIDEAKYWCKDLQIDMEQLNPEWKAWIENLSTEDANHDPPIVAWESDSSDKVYHRLVIEPNQIIFIDDAKKFEDMCDELQTEVSNTLILTNVETFLLTTKKSFYHSSIYCQWIVNSLLQMARKIQRLHYGRFQPVKR